jgi:WD40 repeat protein
VKSAALSKDGGVLLTISETNNGQVWDVSTGKVLHSNIAHDKPFNASFSMDGTQVVTASDDQTVRVWEARTGKLLHVLEHNGRVFHAEFSSDGHYLLTVDGEAKLWDTSSYIFVRRLGEFVAFATFAPDAHAVVTFGKADAIATWDIANGVQISTNEFQRRKLFGLRQHLEDVSPDGRLVVEIAGGRPFLNDLDKLALHQEIKIKEGLFDVQAISAEFSPDNRTIMIVLNDSFNRRVRLYECDLCGSFEELLRRAKQRLGRH